ncbi:MAG: hydrogenase maturation nickel metallochaperone HypA [Chloroflexota bacterium]|nr:hydrogenase maturation nickel metallochaperone HypA [Chloroflexota bacterium]
MHEMSVLSSILEIVNQTAKEAGAERVTRINLVIGERANLVDDSLWFAFSLLSRGTLCAEAELNIRHTRLSFYCATCQSNYTPPIDNFRCPVCHQIGQITGDGREMLIESIEVAD